MQGEGHERRFGRHGNDPAGARRSGRINQRQPTFCGFHDPGRTTQRDQNLRSPSGECELIVQVAKCDKTLLLGLLLVPKQVLSVRVLLLAQ